MDRDETQHTAEEWEQIHQEERSLTLEERKSHQLEKLSKIVSSLHLNFGDNLISATKSIRGESLNSNEQENLSKDTDSAELTDRIRGLIKVFSHDFYKALESVSGIGFDMGSPQQKETSQTTVVEEEPTEDEDAESPRASKIPRGFNKWDLKQLKLHESTPAQGKRIFVDYYTLKGQTDTGEILYNSNKDLFYFKPYQAGGNSFAVTEEQGRKATVQARNYYFRVCPNPPEVE